MDDEEAARRYKSGFWSLGMSLSWMICRTPEAVMYAAKCDEPNVSGRFSPPSAYWALHIGSLEALRDPRARNPRLFPGVRDAMESLASSILEGSILVRGFHLENSENEGYSRTPGNTSAFRPEQWNGGIAIFHDNRHGYVIYPRTTQFQSEIINVITAADTGINTIQSTFINSNSDQFFKDIILCSCSVRRQFPGLSGPANGLGTDRRWQALRLCEHIVSKPPGHKLQYVNCNVKSCRLRSINCAVKSSNCVKADIDTSTTIANIAIDVSEAARISEELALSFLRRSISASRKRGDESAEGWIEKQRGGRPSNTANNTRKR